MKIINILKGDEKHAIIARKYIAKAERNGESKSIKWRYGGGGGSVIGKSKPESETAAGGERAAKSKASGEVA